MMRNAENIYYNKIMKTVNGRVTQRLECGIVGLTHISTSYDLLLTLSRQICIILKSLVRIRLCPLNLSFIYNFNLYNYNLAL